MIHANIIWEEKIFSGIGFEIVFFLRFEEFHNTFTLLSISQFYLASPLPVSSDKKPYDLKTTQSKIHG